MPVAGFSCCSRQFSESLCIAVHPVGFGTACFVFGIHCNCFAVRPAASDFVPRLLSMWIPTRYTEGSPFRSVLIADVNRKACTTSYPNLTDETFMQAQFQGAAGNNQ